MSIIPSSLSALFHPVYTPRLLKIRSKIYEKISDINVSYATQKEPFTAKQGDYKVAKKNTIWAKGHEFDCAQFHIEGKIPDGFDNDQLGVIVNITGEGTIYDKKNYPVLALTTKLGHYFTVLQAHPAKTLLPVSKLTNDKNIDFYIDAGYNGLRMPGFIFGVKLVKINYAIKEFYYDYLLTIYLFIKDKKKDTENVLQKSYELFCDGKVEEASVLLKKHYIPYKKDNKELFYAVGHSHLDLVWLWPKRETMRKSVRTFTNQINNISQYPGYVYGASQPQQFAWIKEQQPELFEKIKEEYKKGNIELQGAMWVEADTNITGGESLIRQIKYGQQFWKDNFDFESTICWLPDVFGYNGNLPQILSKSGVDNFMTIKLSWNSCNKFPYHTFRWKGIDDSEVLVHMPTSGNYVGDGTPLCFRDAIKGNTEKNVNKLLYEFGFGDGGGGAGEIQMELLKRQTQMDEPTVKFSGSEEFFRDLRAENYDLPSYKGELYLEKHQGTYTTQGKMKKFNRILENLLESVESVWTRVFLKSGEYPKDKIESVWKDVLFYQFHDSLPGSSIGRVYKEGNKHQEQLIDSLHALLVEGFEKLGKTEENIYNPAPVFYDAKYLDGGKCYHLSCEPRSTATPVEIIEKNDELKENRFGMENDKIRLEFESDGSFVIFDKNGNRNLGRYNEMRMYLDPRVFFNAWEIAHWYNKLPHFSLSCVEVENKVVGDAFIRRQTLRFGHSYIKQTITIFVGSKLVRVDNVALLNRRHHMYRCNNRPTFWADEVTCDIQYGNIKRRTTTNNSIEKAQYEICSHKYLDINDGKQGVAFLSDCKYGSRVKNGLVSLTCVRNPIYPDPNADRGEQFFSYAFYPYAGTFESSDVVEQSYMFNNPLKKVNGKTKPIVSVNGKVICEVVKKADDGKAIVIRVYEPRGRKEIATIVPHFEYKAVFETDLQENKPKDTKLLDMAFTPFEIKTLKFEL